MFVALLRDEHPPTYFALLDGVLRRVHVGVSVHEWIPERLLHPQPQGTEGYFVVVGEMVLQEARELE